MVDEDFFGTHSKHIDDKTIENNLKHSIAELLLSKIGQLTSSSLEFISTKSALLKFSDSKQFLGGFLADLLQAAELLVSVGRFNSKHR